MHELAAVARACSSTLKNCNGFVDPFCFVFQSWRTSWRWNLRAGLRSVCTHTHLFDARRLVSIVLLLSELCFICWTCIKIGVSVCWRLLASPASIAVLPPSLHQGADLTPCSLVYLSGVSRADVNTAGRSQHIQLHIQPWLHMCGDWHHVVTEQSEGGWGPARLHFSAIRAPLFFFKAPNQCSICSPPIITNRPVSLFLLLLSFLLEVPAGVSGYRLLGCKGAGRWEVEGWRSKHEEGRERGGRDMVRDGRRGGRKHEDFFFMIRWWAQPTQRWTMEKTIFCPCMVRPGGQRDEE